MICKMNFSITLLTGLCIYPYVYSDSTVPTILGILKFCEDYKIPAVEKGNTFSSKIISCVKHDNGTL